MRAVELVFAVGWAVFWLYWLVAALSTKRGRVAWSLHLRIRVVLVVAAIILVLVYGLPRVGCARSHPTRGRSMGRRARASPLFISGLRPVQR